MPSTEPPRPGREARLLDEALLRHHPRWKAPHLAKATATSLDWTRAVVRGYRNVGKGSYEPVVPDAAMLATMARALGNVNEQDLREIGRDDAAEALKVLSRDAPPAGADVAIADRLVRIRDEIDGILRELRSQ